LIGPGFLENAPPSCDPDPATNRAALERLLRAILVKPIPQKTFDALMGYALMVSPQVRANIISRELDYTDVLEQLTVPVLVTHGRADTVVLPAMAEYILSTARPRRPHGTRAPVMRRSSRTRSASTRNWRSLRVIFRVEMQPAQRDARMFAGGEPAIDHHSPATMTLGIRAVAAPGVRSSIWSSTAADQMTSRRSNTRSCHRSVFQASWLPANGWSMAGSPPANIRASRCAGLHLDPEDQLASFANSLLKRSASSTNVA